VIPSRPHSVGRTKTGAATGQGRGARAPAAAKRRTLDGAHMSAGYNSRENDRRSIDFAYVKRAVSLEMVLVRYGYLSHLKRAGSQLRGACPIHNGSNPHQFVVNLNSNTWHCFGDCNRGGGTLEFVGERERVPVPRAAELIAEWFSLSNSPSTRTAATSHRRTAMTGRPSHRAYVIEDREGDQTDQSGFWTRIGSAWPHKDGKGLNVQLVPGIAVSGRLVLREYTDEDAKVEEGKRKPAKK